MENYGQSAFAQMQAEFAAMSPEQQAAYNNETMQAWDGRNEAYADTSERQMQAVAEMRNTLFTAVGKTLR